MVTIKISPNSGNEFELRNVRDIDWNCERPPNQAGNMGSRYHEIGTIRFSRVAGLQQPDGSVEPEDEAILISSKNGDRGYCAGEIQITPEDDAQNVIRQMRWDRGYISSIGESINVDADGSVQITETIELCVTEWTCNGAKFVRSTANQAD